MMRTTFDPEGDAFYARFAPENAVVVRTAEVSPGVMIDLDAAGNLVGFEVLGIAARAAGTYGGQTIARAAE